MGKNVVIPLILLDRMIELLECWDICEYGSEIRSDYADVLWALRLKKQGIVPRPSYSSLVEDALSEQAREHVRQHFLDRHMLCDDAFFDGEPF